MKFNNTISKELKSMIKACTTRLQRKDVALKYDISIHTLNSLVEGNRNINARNKDCIIELLRISIINSKKMGLTLIDYYAEMKQNKLV
tara:strand:- start:2497 stop:2760 length:264 start_codon:yes stop_codon:yes gene_type:complete